ncbi:hypothetical protein ACIBH1_45390 [Nonomuraea sp. NPDC050663]|uniref:hypothetical protein n=1 Tax=Nonomuraea sp. NPDC050663 TaxID=3364370 RepID=UPI00378DC419
MPDYEAPFDAGGNLMHYARKPYHGQAAYYQAHEWRPNEPFVATLTMASTRRGRSAAYFIWADAEGRTYPMFMTDVADLVRDAVINQGTVTGQWTVRKRGENFGIRFHGPAEAVTA